MKQIIALNGIIPRALEKRAHKDTLKSMRNETAILLRKIKKDRIEQVEEFLNNKDKMTPNRQQ